MSKEKQIEDMRKTICDGCGIEHTHCGFISNGKWCPTLMTDTERLYKAGYRKQSEGEWVNNHCSVCGMTPIGEETWERHGDTPPRFELFMDYCSNCGARMRGGDRE